MSSHHHHQCGHGDRCLIPAHPQCVACEIDEEPLDVALVMRYRWRVIMPTEVEVAQLMERMDRMNYL